MGRDRLLTWFAEGERILSEEELLGALARARSEQQAWESASFWYRRSGKRLLRPGERRPTSRIARERHAAEARSWVLGMDSA